jgi:putative phosphonate metabolism protein
VSPRYAIYYAPAQEDPLLRTASAWLGRDAFDGRTLPRPLAAELQDLDLDALTADPRGYGFHATLKAPFELAEGASEEELLDFARAFAAGQASFEASLAPAALGRFLALRLETPTPQMDDLAAACVRAFDPFRAPLSDFDLARRRKAPLSPEQDARLVEWGYPYIFEDFRFHMTLTGQIADETVRSRVLHVLQGMFPAKPHRFDAVAVFKQNARNEPFHVIARSTFAGATVSP